MNRREVINSMGLISLHALYPSVLSGFLSSFRTGKRAGSEWVFFDAEEQVIVEEMTDIILPGTSTKSASEAGVPFFLDEIFAKCLQKEQKYLIKDGFSAFRKQWNGTGDKAELVRSLDQKAFGGDEDVAWFKTFKKFTLIGFFTSEEGTTRAGDYQKIPERYVGEVKTDENTLAHGKTTLRFN